MNRPSWLRCPWVSREWADTLAKRVERREQQRDAAFDELALIKDEIALHIVAAKHPSSALFDAHSFAVALQETLEANGIELRVQLARLEGADL